MYMYISRARVMFLVICAVWKTLGFASLPTVWVEGVARRELTYEG